MEHKVQTLQHSLRRINKVWRHLGRQHFIKIGLGNGQPKILQLLSQHEGCSQKDLAKLCHIQPATVTSLLNHLEKDELIYRMVSPNDRRITHVHLTEKGKDLQKEVDKIFSQMDTQALAGFTKSEKDQLSQFMDRIYENLKLEETGEHV